MVSSLALIKALKSLSLAQPGIKPHLRASNVFPFYSVIDFTLIKLIKKGTHIFLSYYQLAYQ